MKRVVLILMLLAMTVPALGQEISEDGHDFGTPSTEPGQGLIRTDDVPLPSSPDYSCDIRMQVGGLNFGDFDNDGDLDLAVGCYHSQSYPPYDDWRNFVLRNNDGQLETTPSWWTSDSKSTTDLKWADFNGDGFLDLFCANGDASFDRNSIYFGSADGLANTPGWTGNDVTFTTGCAPSDFDRDGDIDMATTNQGMSPDPYRPVYIYQNTGTGLNPTPAWQSSALEISGFCAWGDVNNDSFPELGVSKWVNFQTCYYANNAGVMGNTPAWTSGPARADKGVGWADVDGDSFQELAVGASDPTLLFDNVDGVLGDSPIWQSVNSYHGCQDLAWGDIDGDGDPDLATVEFSNGHIRIYLNVDGVLESSPSWMYDGAGMGTALAFGDINGDGHLDLAMGLSGQPCVHIFLNVGETGVEDEAPVPGALALSQNYPNPFNAETKIEFELESAAHARLDVFDLMGQRVATLIDGELGAGKHSVGWNTAEMSSGMYYYRLSASGQSNSKRMLLLK